MISAYAWNKIARQVLRGEAQTWPSTLWLAFYSAPMTADGTGGTELSGGNYSRIELDCDTTNWAVPVGKDIVTGVAVPLPVPAADWDEAVYAALVDTASGAANTWFHDECPAFTNKEGQRRSFDAGSIIQRAR